MTDFVQPGEGMPTVQGSNELVAGDLDRDTSGTLFRFFRRRRAPQLVTPAEVELNHQAAIVADVRAILGRWSLGSGGPEAALRKIADRVGYYLASTGPEDGQATAGSPERPVMEGVDAVASDAAHVGASTFWVIERGQPEGFRETEYIEEVSYFDGEHWTADWLRAAKWDKPTDAQKWIDAYGVRARAVEHGLFASRDRDA